jgi:hypothetical protein
MYLFVRYDDVDIVNASEAVVSHRKQAVSVRRQIDAHNAGALVRDHVEKTGILMGETVVVLPPDQSGDQQIE